MFNVSGWYLRSAGNWMEPGNETSYRRKVEFSILLFIARYFHVSIYLVIGERFVYLPQWTVTYCRVYLLIRNFLESARNSKKTYTLLIFYINTNARFILYINNTIVSVIEAKFLKVEIFCQLSKFFKIEGAAHSRKYFELEYLYHITLHSAVENLS